MPIELRHLVFTSAEVIDAIKLYYRSRGRTLPNGEIKDTFAFETDRDFSVGFRLPIQLSRSEDTGARGQIIDFGLSGVELVAALIMHCRHRKIPIPTNASKLLQCFDKEVGLTIVVNNHSAPLVERLMDRAGSLKGREETQVLSASRDSLSPVRKLVSLLEGRTETLAICENATDLSLSSALNTVMGAGSLLYGGIFSNSEEGARQLLAIQDRDLAWMRASPEAYVQLLARKIRECCGTTWGLAQTLGPDPAVHRRSERGQRLWMAVSGPAEGVRAVDIASDDPVHAAWSIAEASLELVQAVSRSRDDR